MWATLYRPLSEEYPTFHEAKLTDIFNIISFDYTKRFYSVGEFTMTIPADEQAVTYITKDTILLTSEGEDLYITDTEETANTMVIKGYDLKVLLAMRLSLFPSEEQDSGTYGYYVVKGSTEHCIKDIVRYNITEAQDEERRIYGFSVAKEQDRGLADDRYMTRLEALDVVVGTLCANAEIGWDITADTVSSRYVFDVVVPTDRSDSQHEVSKVVFAEQFLNVTGFSRKLGVSGLKNAIYAINGSGSEDPYVQLVNRDDVIAVGVYRKETAANVNCDYDEIKDYALKDAEDKTETDSFEMEVQAADSYKRDWFLGDICTFKNEKAQLDSSIIEVNVSRTADSYRVKLTAGNSTPTVFGALSNSVGKNSRNGNSIVLNGNRYGVGLFANKEKNAEIFNDYEHNTATAFYSHTAGEKNKNDGYASSVLGGINNSVPAGKCMIIGGGYYNRFERAEDEYSTILNGTNNVINSSFSTIIGGSSNRIYESEDPHIFSWGKVYGNALIGSGNSNTIDKRSIDDYYTQSYPSQNTYMHHDGSTILNGNSNEINVGHAFIADGMSNRIYVSAEYSAIITGNANHIGRYSSKKVTTRYSFIGTAACCYTQAEFSAILCGNNSYTYGKYSTICNGDGVQVGPSGSDYDSGRPEFTFVGTGTSIRIKTNSSFNFIGAADGTWIINPTKFNAPNEWTGNDKTPPIGSAVVAGSYHSVGNTISGFIGMGTHNYIGSYYDDTGANVCVFSSVLNGSFNTVKEYGRYVTIIDGHSNEAGSECTTVINGMYNQSFQRFSAIISGYTNRIEDNKVDNGGYSIIGNGCYNVIKGDKNFIGAGISNNIETGGEYAAIINGYSNIASHRHTLLHGNQLQTDCDYQVAFGHLNAQTGEQDLLQIGNGVWGKGELIRSNAFRVRADGNSIAQKGFRSPLDGQGVMFKADKQRLLRTEETEVELLGQPEIVIDRYNTTSADAILIDPTPGKEIALADYRDFTNAVEICAEVTFTGITSAIIATLNGNEFSTEYAMGYDLKNVDITEDGTYTLPLYAVKPLPESKHLYMAVSLTAENKEAFNGLTLTIDSIKVKKESYAGLFVTLEDDTAVPAEANSKYIAGVTSYNAAFTSGHTSDSEYVDVITSGNAIVIDDGTCSTGGYCKPSDNGTATVAEREDEYAYRVLRREDENHIKISLDRTFVLNDYEKLRKKPKIAGRELYGDKSFDELGLQALSNMEINFMLESVRRRMPVPTA